MAWTYAKTDWIQTDYLTLNDNHFHYHRIRDNIKYLQDLAFEINEPWTAYSMYTLVYSSDLKADVMNSLEKNIQLLIDGTQIKFLFEPTKLIFANETVRDYKDLNRIEQTTYILYQRLNAQKTYKKQLVFELGGDWFG